MKGSIFAATLPEGRTSGELVERGKLIVDAVRQGLFLPLDWYPVQSGDIGFMVMGDALRIGEPDDYVRVNVTAPEQQQIADLLGVSLLTAKMNDLAYKASQVIIEPCTQPDSVANGTMSHTTAMLRHSREVDDQLAGRRGLAGTTCKTWVLPNQDKPGYGANHGWHTQHARSPKAAPGEGPFPCRGGGWIWQNLGMAHFVGHVDYSQCCLFAYPTVRRSTEDGVLYLPLAQALQDAKLAPFLHYEGVCRFLRQPDVRALPVAFPQPQVCL